MFTKFLLPLAGLYVLYRLLQSLTLAYRRRLFKKAKGCAPMRKYPQKDPILGLDLLFPMIKHMREGGFVEVLLARFNNVGAYTWRSHMMGTVFYSTADPENVKAMLATQFQDFDLSYTRKHTMQPVFGHGIFANNGHEWEVSRALLRPNFNRAQLADLDALETHVAKVVAQIPTDGSTVDLQNLFFLLTMDSATEFLFGHSSRSLDPGTLHESGAKFAQAFTDATHLTGILARSPPALWRFLKTKKFANDIKYIHEYISEYVQKAVDIHKNGLKRSEKYVFLEELAATGQSKEKIQAELMNVLLAGRDTTAGLLSYVFYTLARNKRVLDKLQEEVEQLNGDKPGYDTIKGMKYLQCVLNEALRLFPVVPLNAREANKDTTLPVGGGPDGKSPIFVPKGQIINYQPYVLHRRKDLYGEDAEVFRPERWEKGLRPGWGYVPFNGGPRICIGQQYALMEASYTTVRILQNFKSIEPRDEAPYIEMLSLTSSIRGGVQVSLTPR